jgi:hypothetical protein
VCHKCARTQEDCKVGENLEEDLRSWDEPGLTINRPGDFLHGDGKHESGVSVSRSAGASTAAYYGTKGKFKPRKNPYRSRRAVLMTRRRRRSRYYAYFHITSQLLLYALPHSFGGNSVDRIYLCNTESALNSHRPRRILTFCVSAASHTSCNTIPTSSLYSITSSYSIRTTRCIFIYQFCFALQIEMSQR